MIKERLLNVYWYLRSAGTSLKPKADRSGAGTPNLFLREEWEKLAELGKTTLCDRGQGLDLYGFGGYQKTSLYHEQCSTPL
jgi:hypothetical protein